MSKRIWKVNLDNVEYAVEVKYDPLTAQHVLSLDEHVLEKSVKMFGNSGNHEFMINGHKCVATIERKGITYDCSLTVDGTPQT